MNHFQDFSLFLMLEQNLNLYNFTALLHKLQKYRALAETVFE